MLQVQNGFNIWKQYRINKLKLVETSKYFWMSDMKQANRNRKKYTSFDWIMVHQYGQENKIYSKVGQY